MTETYRDNRRKPKPRRRQGVRLNVEELEGRCLLSSGFGPLGGITTGPDGDIWFLEKDRLGRIDPHSGLIQEFAKGINTGLPWYGSDTAGHSIAEAPDGSIWFLSNGQVTRFTPSTNAVDTFNLPAGSSPLDSLTIAPDGVVWVLEEQPQPFGAARIDPATGGVENYVPPPMIVIAYSDGLVMPAMVEDVDQSYVGPPASSPPPFWWACSSCAIPPKIASDGSSWALTVSGIPAAGSEFIEGYYPSTGNSKQFPVEGRLIQLTPGPDGNIWYTYLTYTNGNAADGTPEYFVGQLNPTTGAFESFSPARPSQAPPGNPPPATGATLSATAGFDFVSAVASFTPQAPIATPGQAYQATVDWGDGTTSSIVLTVTASGTYDVVASHAYQTAGTYSIKVTIGNFDPANPLGDNPITVFSTATVDPFNMNM